MGSLTAQIGLEGGVWLGASEPLANDAEAILFAIHLRDVRQTSPLLKPKRFQEPYTRRVMGKNIANEGVQPQLRCHLLSCVQ